MSGFIYQDKEQWVGSSLNYVPTEWMMSNNRPKVSKVIASPYEFSWFLWLSVDCEWVIVVAKDNNININFIALYCIVSKSTIDSFKNVKGC